MSDDLYRRLLEQASDCILVINAQGIIDLASEGLEKMTGYIREELIDQPVELLVPERFQSHIQLRDKYIAKPKPLQMGTGRELVARRKDGSEFPVEISLNSLATEQGLIVTVMLIDITERKQAEESLKNYENIVNTTNDFMAFIDTDYVYRAVNQRYLDAYQKTLGEIIGHSVSEVLGIDFFKTHVKKNLDRCLDGEGFSFQFWRNYPGLGKRYMDVYYSPYKEVDGSVTGLVLSMRNITTQKQAEEKLLKLTRAVEASSSIVMITNIEGNIEYVNSKFTEVTGYSMEEAIGQNPSILKSGETPDATYVEMWEAITSGHDWKGEYRNKRKDGSFYWARISISGVKDINGEITHFISIQDDVSREYKLTEQITHQASHDALTGLVNRREFERRIEQLLSTIKQDKTEHALCFMDLDQFKVVNDTCGHAAGDELLCQLASVLQDAVRHRDTLARLGGDEFGLLMEHCSVDHAHRVAKLIQEAVQDYQFTWEEHIFRVGVSIGLVAITEAVPNLSELLKHADAACYMAKDSGRNRIHVYHPEDAETDQRHGEMQWVARIYQALEEDRFILYAQSIVPLNGSTDKHYELLIRMKDEKGQIVPPGAFLPAAERYNLIGQLDSWVIKNAFRLLTENPAFLKKIHFISINLSGQSLTNHDFLDFIISELDKSGIEGKKICIEITETTAISNLFTARKFITALKELGCRFALDDFGSGLSSFGYLKNLPVDYLKIDGMFVRGIVDDPIDYAMVKSINEIGQVIGIQTIAEFVENDEIKRMLKVIGVNYAQGYGIGTPQPFDELLDRSKDVIDIKDAENVESLS